MEEKQSNFVKYMSNPKSFTLKRWMYEMLGNKYGPHDNIIERVSSALVTDKDLEDFGKLIGQVYDTAYRKAVDDYREQCEKIGLKVSIGTKEIN